jgi:hypothetical protein
MKKILFVILAILIGIIIYVWMFTSFYFGGSKDCDQAVDCKQTKVGILEGCWSRKPIKIGQLEIGYLAPPFTCECVNNYCEKNEK